MKIINTFKTLFFLVCIFFIITPGLNTKEIKFAFVKSSSLNLRDAPSLKSNIIDKLKRNTKVYILKRKGSWCFVNVEKSKERGWVYKGGLTKIHSMILPDYNVTIEFNGFNENSKEKILQYKNYLIFDFYKRDVKLVFSYDKKLNICRLFIFSSYNYDYYNQNRDTSIKSNQIDLYPFLKFAFVYDNFIKRFQYKYKSLADFLKKFLINIVLYKGNGEYVIIELYRKNKMYTFRPYLFLKKEGYKLMKIVSEDPELVKKSYIFTLGPPYLSDGTPTIYSLIYDFFYSKL